MLQLKTVYKFSFLFSFLILFQGCAINDKQQRQWLDSGSSLIQNITKKPLSDQDIAAGLKQALTIGAERVVLQVGKKDGYLKDKLIHIALPKELLEVHKVLNQIGLGHYTRELEIKMNRAAEIAAPKAKKLFFSAIENMRWQDVKGIYNGKNDAATQYFKRKMTPSLKQMMKPVIEQTLAQTGVVQAYKKVMQQYNSIPFVQKMRYDLTDYVMDKGINGMFYYLAKEEAAIRQNPAKRTTALLKRLFD